MKRSMSDENNLIKIIAFDADDTLWCNESYYNYGKEKFAQILSKYSVKNNIKKIIDKTERKNISLYGYGLKSFTLSLIEASIILTQNKITAKDISEIISLGKELIRSPVKVFPQTEKILQTLEQSFPLMIITKGDLFDQEEKIRKSGLAKYFTYIEIVSEKNESIYEDILKRHKISPNEFLMIGNSLKSDILPILSLGSKAIYVHNDITWDFEHVEDTSFLNRKGCFQCELKDLVKIIEKMK